MTYEHVGGTPAEPDIDIIDIDCPEPFFEEGCIIVDPNGDEQRCPLLDEQGYCTWREGIIKITLDELIKVLRWIQVDERDFDLSYPVKVDERGISVLGDGFLYQKIKWFLGLGEGKEK